MPELKEQRSIAFRLIAGVLAVEFVASVAIIFLSLGYERHMHFRAFDIMLHGRADSVLGAVQDAEDSGLNVMLDLPDLHVPSEDVYEVWDGRGHLLGRSPNWQGSAGNQVPDHDGISRITLNDAQYGLLRHHGSRIIDPGEPGGGKLRHVTILYGAPTSHVWHAIQGAVEFYAAGSLLMLLITGPLIAWLLHRGLLPLRQLAALAGNVSVDAWAFNPPASASATPELAPLTHALENVLARLERSFTQQRTFVSDAAHELKTAVAVIKSSLQLLALKPRSPGEYKVGLERCLSDSDRLENLVAKMLTLARVESGVVPPGVNPTCDMAVCAHAVIAQLETLAHLRNVSVELKTDPGCVVPLTPEDCALLIENLLTNALVHSANRQHVQIRIHHTAGTAPGTPGHVLLAVEDHGDGIDPEALPHVFDRFYRGDPSRSRSTGGSGLGLAICKALVDKASGTIEIKTELGAGTTVSVRFSEA